MDLIRFSRDVENVLRKVATEFDQLSQPTEDGALWGFELEDDASGFVSLESNQGTLDVPTVTISLSLGAIEEVSREDLMDLLTINGDLLGASLTITLPWVRNRRSSSCCRRNLSPRSFLKTCSSNPSIPS